MILRKQGLVATALALVLLAGCAEREPILPGERLNVREVLETRAAEAAEAPVEGARPIALPETTRNAGWAQSPVSPFARTPHPALDGLRPAWSVSIGAGDSRRQRIIADPVVAGGRIFTLDADNRVQATSTGGTVLWTADLVPPRDGPDQGQGGGLAVAEGVLYVSSGFGTISALDAGTGAERWVQELDNTATGAPSVAGDLVYVTSGDRTGWAIERGDGRVRWQIDGRADINNVAGSPAPALGEKHVLFSFGDGSVQAAFLQGGLRLWNAGLQGRRTGVTVAGIDDITGDPVIVGDTVYAGNHSGRFAAFNIYDGERLWTVRHGARGPAWPAGDSLFFVTDLDQLLRVDRQTGDVIWRVDLPGYRPVRNPQRGRDAAYVNHGPILAGGRLLVAGSDGLLRAFDPVDGRAVAQVAIPDGATTAPVVADGTLYVVSRRGVLHAYR